MSARCSLETEPWWALAMTASAPLLEPGLGDDLGRDLVRLGTLAGRALGGDLVEPRREPLGQPAAVGEDDGALVLLDQVDDVLLDVRPDRLRPSSARRTSSSYSPGAVMSSTGTTTLRSHSLVLGGATISTGALPPRNRATSSSGRTVALQPDPLGGLVEQRVEPLEGDREVGAALGAGDGVHLVDDHRLDAAQALAGLAGEHQEQRLRRRDQDVGRLGDEPAPVGGRGVARADADRHLGDLLAEPVAGVADAGQRAAQVALDVDRERLERADVEHPGALRPVGRSLAGQQPVEAPQERAQRLAGPGRRDHQRVLAGPDRRPTPRPGPASAPRTPPRTTRAWAR